MDAIDRFFEEDLGRQGDITSDALFSSENAVGEVWVKQPCMLAGLEEASVVFARAGASFSGRFHDGDMITEKSVVGAVSGPVKGILKAERLALNFLGRMSGIATQTKELVDLCRTVNPRVHVAATRKTTPGFRAFEKKAVVIGGGEPHRMGLYDAILIKDNHLRVIGSVEKAVAAVQRARPGMPVEIEVEDEHDALVAARLGVACIMLDNMDPWMGSAVASKIRALDPKILIEVSGGITTANIAQYARYADRISVGALTHSVRSVDFSLELIG